MKSTERMTIPFSDIGELADLCRSKGISFIKYGDIEFSLFEHVPPTPVEKSDTRAPLGPQPVLSVEAELDAALGIGDLMRHRSKSV